MGEAMHFTEVGDSNIGTEVSITGERNLLWEGSVANKLATYAAEASKPSLSSIAFSERSLTSNPVTKDEKKYGFFIPGFQSMTSDLN